MVKYLKKIDVKYSLLKFIFNSNSNIKISKEEKNRNYSVSSINFSNYLK